MTIPPEAVGVIASLVQAGVAGVIDLLSDDGKAAVRERLEVARERLPAPGSVARAVDEVLARHVAHRLPQVTHATADALARMSSPRSGALLTVEERHALTVAVSAIRAIADASEVPPVLDVPVGAWSEPGHEGD